MKVAGLNFDKILIKSIKYLRWFLFASENRGPDVNIIDIGLGQKGSAFGLDCAPLVCRPFRAGWLMDDWDPGLRSL